MADDSETAGWYSPAKCAKRALTGEDYVAPKVAKRPRAIEDSQEAVMTALGFKKDGNGVELRQLAGACRKVAILKEGNIEKAPPS